MASGERTIQTHPRIRILARPQQRQQREVAASHQPRNKVNGIRTGRIAAVVNCLVQIRKITIRARVVQPVRDGIDKEAPRGRGTCGGCPEFLIAFDV